ncbi:hypothetical protein E4T25_07275 [Photobacterium damselae subsp. piscicida]|uniref:EpsG family protein n=1 Tax=Photobacterium damselae TaxID=38293 RepID=UPI0010763E05|nr:EpsG family protein [Photobacterium damselae]TFZ61532.1 hypothetical protein E4T25_07275 [Photobacterium damselae subsp. piscicida]
MKIYRECIGYQFSVSSFYFLSCIWWSHNVEIRSDTLSYFINYQNIEVYPFPYGVEILLPTIMLVCKSIGFDFNDFVALILIMWLPVVQWATRKSVDNPLFILIIIFFFSGKFNELAMFLMRSYLSIIMFVFSIAYGDWRKFAFYGLCVLSHITSLMFILCYSLRMYVALLGNKLISILILLVSIIVSKLITASTISNLDIGSISNIMLSEINRKLSFYHDTSDFISANPIIILIVIIVSLLVILNKPVTDKERKIDSLIFSQTILCIGLSGVIHLSNRIGIIAFSFYIPIMIYYLNNALRNGVIKI